MRRALVAVHTSTYFTTLIDVGRVLKKSKSYDALFCFLQRYPTLENDLRTLRSEGTEYVVPQVELAPGDIQRRWRRLAQGHLGELPSLAWRIMRGGAWRIWSHVGKSLFTTTLYHLCFLLLRWRTISRLFRALKPDLIILGGDLTHYDTALFIKVAHRQGIPAVVVPAWMASAREAAEACMYDPVYSANKWFNALVGKMYPRWVYEHKGRRLLRLPGEQVLAREWLRLAPPLPWILHSGYADAIAVESEAMREYGIREGLPAEGLVVTGSATHDRLAVILQDLSARRADLYRRLNLRADYPLLLCALPPDFLYMVGGRPECEFCSYDELVRFWVTTLAAVSNHNVVIALHPSMQYENMRYIEQWGARIACDSTAALIPLCDLYVASISATIQWAIACGKPVLNYDVYRYQYTDYLGVGGVISVENREQFRAAVQRLTDGPAYYREIAARQAACAEKWGKLDGRAGERLLELFDRLGAQYHSKAETHPAEVQG